MKERIYELLKELVAHKSISSTEMETGVEKYVYDFLKQIPYFQKHPEQVGFHKIPNDAFGRAIPYGLILGKSKKTVILSGHLDVVSTEVYGEAEDLACTIGSELEEKLSHMELNDTQRKDMESDEWIWGRGVCDMKGGIAIAMYLVEKYAEMAEKGELEGSILFSAVADEESYSAGMRAITTVYLDLKNKYDLDFKLLLDPEPASEDGDAQVMSLGTIGKTLPVIMVQGELAHIGHSYNGINALNILTGIFKKTNGSLKFVDTYKDEACLPPAWQNLRDLKDLYDASLPFRAAGYMTMFNFDRSLETIMDQLCQISTDVFEEEVTRLNDEYQEYKKLNHFEKKEKIYYEPLVYTVGELCEKLREDRGPSFDDFYESIKEEAGEKVAAGESYPNATIFMMRSLMAYADIKQPYVLIGVAPPYYPATHSDMIEGKEGFGSKIFKFAKELSEKEFGQKLTYEHYFTGISDNSYTSLPDIDGDFIAASYPMWGKSYSLDFESIKAISVPSILYGPIGREYHQWTERVNKRSLFEVMPHMIEEVIKFAWKN